MMFHLLYYTLLFLFKKSSFVLKDFKVIAEDVVGNKVTVNENVKEYQKEETKQLENHP